MERPFCKAYEVRWIPPGFDWVDPLKDIKAQVLAVRAGFISRSEVVSQGGYDSEAIDREIAADNQRADSLGLRHESDARQSDSPQAEQENEGTAIYRARGKKPIAAYVDDLAASGAYWLASAADRIVVSDTARLGSIGVLATIVEEAETEGVKTYRFVSSVSPNKRPDLESEEGRDSVQELVDDLGRVFVETVARSRGVTTEKVIADFGKGFLRTARKAVAAGMADAIGTYEDVRADLSGRSSASRNSLGVAAAASPISKKKVAMEEPIRADVRTPAENPEPALPALGSTEGSGSEGANAETPTGKQATESPSLGEVAKPEKPTLVSAEGERTFEAGRTEALAYAAEVAELCALAGMGNKAAGFIRNGTAVEDVRKALLSERAAQDSVEIRSHTMPGTGTTAKPSLENNPVVQASAWRERIFREGDRAGGGRESASRPVGNALSDQSQCRAARIDEPAIESGNVNVLTFP